MGSLSMVMVTMVMMVVVVVMSASAFVAPTSAKIDRLVLEKIQERAREAREHEHLDVLLRLHRQVHVSEFAHHDVRVGDCESSFAYLVGVSESHRRNNLARYRLMNKPREWSIDFVRSPT